MTPAGLLVFCSLLTRTLCVIAPQIPGPPLRAGAKMTPAGLLVFCSLLTRTLCVIAPQIPGTIVQMRASAQSWS
ncbi:putative defective proboscis extension response [Operophtera brumata]|uniref:Putative defective proboscis extension response n=1 Tax=Operophtera brumata TaxID=104452 RepID=A0A0L7LNS9_OPEBR|nr:putative defective proboscis extension response [Operophtera brumata]